MAGQVFLVFLTFTSRSQEFKTMPTAAVNPFLVSAKKSPALVGLLGKSAVFPGITGSDDLYLGSSMF